MLYSSDTDLPLLRRCYEPQTKMDEWLSVVLLRKRNRPTANLMCAFAYNVINICILPLHTTWSDMAWIYKYVERLPNNIPVLVSTFKMKTGTTYFFKITLHVKKTVFFSSLLERFFFLSKNMTSNRMFLSRFLFSPTTSTKTASFLSTLCFFFQYRCKITINGFGTCHKIPFPPLTFLSFFWPIRLKTILGQKDFL